MKYKHINVWIVIVFVLQVVRKASHIQEKFWKLPQEGINVSKTYGQKETVDMWPTWMRVCCFIDLLEVRRGTSQTGNSCHHSRDCDQRCETASFLSISQWGGKSTPRPAGGVSSSKLLWSPSQWSCRMIHSVKGASLGRVLSLIFL